MKKVFYAVLITLMSTSLFAQTHPNFASVRSVRDVLGTDTVDARIEAGQIKYWVGEGSHSVIFAANWADPDTALAWGYRFSEDSVTVFAVMDALAKADQRFSYDTSIGTYGPYLNDLWFVTSTGDTLKLAGNYWMINVNGMGAANGIASQYVKDNDFVKIGDESAGILKDPNTFWYVWTTAIMPVNDPDPKEATIEASQIKYWVGEGIHSVIFAANWANPDTALAWGYRFSEDSVTVFAVMDTLAKADQRFSYDTSIGTYGPYLNDLWFATSTGDTLKLAGNYWMINVNGMGAANGIASQYVKDNDFVKVGDESAGILKDPNTFWYVWITAVMPVDVPAAVANVQEELMVEVYPNPASDYVQIRYAEAQPATLVLVDMQGRMLKQLRISGDFRMDVSGLAAGMYIVRLQNGDASAIRKIQVR